MSLSPFICVKLWSNQGWEILPQIIRIRNKLLGRYFNVISGWQLILLPANDIRLTDYSFRISGCPKILVLDIRMTKLNLTNISSWEEAGKRTDTNRDGKIYVLTCNIPAWYQGGKLFHIRILHDNIRTAKYSVLNSGLCNFPLNLKMNGFEIILQLDFSLRPP